MADTIETFLDTFGPCLSGQVADYLVSLGVSRATARKRVSRATDGQSPSVKKLAGITFPRRARFVYLQRDFGSPRYWSALESALLKDNSVLGLGLAAIRERDGVVPVAHFQIACGSPLKQLKHLSPDSVFERLRAANLVQKLNVNGLGDCIVLAQAHDHYDHVADDAKVRLITESLLLTAIRDWLRKLGIASYDRVNTRDGKALPLVGTFAWDLSAPSYLAPMLKYSKDGAGKNGFVACDVLLGTRIDSAGIKPFIHKCQTLRRLRNVGTCLQIFVADRYTGDAFQDAKRAGVIPATPASLFGHEVAEGLAQLTQVLRKAAASILEPNDFDSLFKKFGRIEGAAIQLRGTLFEFLTADIARKSMSHTSIRMNHKFKADQREAEADVVVIRDNSDVLMIECKGYSPYAEIPDDLFNRWLQHNVPTCYKAARSHPDWQNLPLKFEFWGTGKLSPASLALFQGAKSTINPNRYTIDLRLGQEVLHQTELTKDFKLVEILQKHFMPARSVPVAAEIEF
ncbi:MAG: hypothetical protein E5X41_30630 [Mesorhizobium sp.]|nr:MAG: hypothetical protein E5X41_30630 [Mesorhizobium sp.]